MPQTTASRRTPQTSPPAAAGGGTTEKAFFSRTEEVAVPDITTPAPNPGPGLLIAARRIAAARSRADQPSDNTGGRTDGNDT